MDEDPQDRFEGPQFLSRRRRGRFSRPPVGVLAVLAGVILVAAMGWFWYRAREAPDPGDTTGPPTATRPLPTDTAPRSPEPDVEPLDLPELDRSDTFVRDLVVGLSAHPQLAAWLVTDELVHRFVAAVVNLAEGASPTAQVEFLIPEEDFRVREEEDRILIDPASYRRYDLLAETFASLDTEGTARLYRQLHPLFEEAYRELGIPDRTFDETLARAMENLLAVPIPDGPMEVTPGEGLIYEFRDRGMEGRAQAEKHLLRMGPDNARRVQAKLEELADALGIPPAAAEDPGGDSGP